MWKLLLSVTIATLWFYFLWSRRRFYRVYWQLRGPLGLPLVGLGLQMMNPEKFLQYLEQLGEQYKTPFISWMGTKCFLYVNNPATIETIFNSACCTDKADLYRFMTNAIGDGLFTASPPRWNKHRRLINPSFSRKAISTFLPIFNREANILANQLSMAEGKPSQIFEILKRSVLQVACQTTMGKKMSFHNGHSDPIFDSYNGITEVCAKRMLSPWLYPEFVYTRSSLFKRQQKYAKVMCKFVENLLHNSIKKTTKSSTNSSIPTKRAETNNKKCIRDKSNVEERVFKRFINDRVINDDEGKNEETIKLNPHETRSFIEQIRCNIEKGHLSWQDVRDEANVIMAAAYETTSTALYLVCLCLAMHPECQDKLYNELVEIFPTATRVPNNSCEEGEAGSLTDITLEHLERMTYAEMVINESMRLFAPVPMVLRQASRDFQLNDGTLIPKGTQIGIDIFNMQRSKIVWGAHARTFNPERHFAADSLRHPFAFIPFTKGLRMCIGYRYALALMKIMLAKIFRNFRIHTDAKVQDLIIKGTISIKLAQYPLCKFSKRKC